MKQRKKIYAAEALFLAAGILLLTGCGEKEAENLHTKATEVQIDVPQVQPVTDDGGKQGETREKGAGENQDTEINVIKIRQYTDREKERMKELQESYQDETAKPESSIQEVDSAEDVTEGTLCYITSTGQFYLPDGELTDEELLEIIDCNFRIALNTNHKTQGEWDDINLKERAEFEAKVKAAGGITEDEAIEIAQKAMEEDIGEKAKGLQLTVADERYGWKAYLWDITDWEEYNAKGGELGWSIHFSNVADVEDEDDLFSYDCMVDAMDGSICGANTQQGFIDGETVWYEH